MSDEQSKYFDPTAPPGAPMPEPVPPDLLAWARQTFNVQEHLDGLRQIREGKGKTLDEFFAELEAVARGS